MEGGSAVRTEVKTSGYLEVRSGGKANSANINANKAEMNILAHGIASNTIVKNGGVLHVSAGGSAINVNIDKTGTMSGNYNSDTYITGTSHGKAVKFGDNVASNITVYEYRYMDVDSKWTAYDTIVSGYNARQYVLEGGSAVRTEVKTSGYLEVRSGGKANSANINANKAEMYILAHGIASNTTVKNGGFVSVYKGGAHHGSLTIADGCKVSVANGGIVDFTVAQQKPADGYLINNLSLITGTPTYTITVSNSQANGTYKLAQKANNFTGTLTIGNGKVDYGTVTVNGADCVYNGVTYSLDNVSGNLSLTVSGNKNSAAENDLDGNGIADVILVHTKQGYSGAWLWDGSKVSWSSLSDIKAGTEILGTGKLYGSADDGQDIFFADNKSVGAWKVTDGKVTGYQNVMSVNATTNVLGLGDFNGDGATDLLLRSTSGDLGFYGTDGTGWEYLIGLGKEWEAVAIGDLNGDGMDDTVVRHKAGFAGTFLTQANGTVKWANLDTLKSDMDIIGAGDFNGDGVDDVLLQNRSNGWVGAWIVEDGSVDSFIGLCTNKNTIEQIADFNGDGIDDLRIRSGSNIGVLYVNGADDTQWQYFKSVGSEWDTSFSALA